LEALNTYKSENLKNFSDDACWYVIYTRPHHEKKVSKKLEEEKINVYLPLQTTLRQWSDRKKKVTIPLFSCYVFVKITPKEYYKVLNISGVIRYVTTNGKAAAIPEKQIQLIRNLLEQDLEMEEIPEKLHKGSKIMITAGPLVGIIGELVDFSGKKRVIIRLEEINKSLLVSVPMYLLQLAG
jgi:transcriptional antiterminator RfaH